MATHDISLMGAVFPDVPKVVLPVDGGGTATFTEVSDTTATASDVASGKYFYASDGTKTAGTASGGGSGLVYETGTYTPASDIAQPTISFANAHTTLPISIMIIDNAQTRGSANSAGYWSINNWYSALGKYVCTTSSTSYKYARITYGYYSSNGMSESQVSISYLTGNNSTSMEYYVSTTAFKPYFGSASRYFRSDKTYQWIAVWGPTT